MVEIVAATHSGMTTEDFGETVKTWLETAKHPRFKVLYTDLVYQPMLELLDYLRSLVVRGKREPPITQPTQHLGVRSIRDQPASRERPG